MKLLLEFFPLLVFFACYKFYDIYTASGALIVAFAIQLVLLWFINRKIEKMQWFTFAMVTFFGGLTLFLQDDAFIKWKVSIIYTLFGVILMGTQLMGKPAIKSLLGKEITLPDTVWTRINTAWALCCFASAVLNYYVAFFLPTETWVNFKVFGLTGITFILLLGTGLYLYKHLPAEKKDEN